MDKDTKPVRVNALDITLFIVCVLFTVGMLTVFRPCSAKEDGTWMTCHWAGNAVVGVAGALTLMSLIHLAVADPRRKQGIDLAMIPAALLTAAIPGRLIGLCMMADMRCHRLTAPGATVFAIIVAAVAVIDFLLRFRRRKNEV
ncbi:MAG: DUF4418 family protein [Oscillospiraceae bacterium]|nr:DUF4418 family protein [Oscillospiraceae bacterium]